jgi:methyltransferase (TIGR00027 family)
MMGQDSERLAALSGVAATSLGVAALRAIETTRDDRLFEDPYAQCFASAAAAGRALPPASASGRDPDFYQLMAPQVALRTRFFDDALLAAAGFGAQVVLLACGMDARAFRLRWPSHTWVFEVDLAETLAFKDAVLARQGAAASCKRVTVAVDLCEDWPAALTEAGWQQRLPTLWLAEGIWYALSADGADDLLRRITAHSAPGSVLAFDHMRDSERLRAARAALSPELVELWRGGPTESPGAWLLRHGWDPSVHDLQEVAADYHRSVPTELTGAPDEASRAWLATATVQGVGAP